MSETATPASTIKIVSMEPVDRDKVRIVTEMVVDVHRLTEVSSQLLKVAMTQVTTEGRTNKT